PAAEIADVARHQITVAPRPCAVRIAADEELPTARDRAARPAVHLRLLTFIGVILAFACAHSCASDWPRLQRPFRPSAGAGLPPGFPALWASAQVVDN